MPQWLTGELGRDVLSGVAVTVAITLITSVGALVVGVLGAGARRSERRWVRRCGGVFVEIFRNVPALILLIFFAFAVPNLFPAELRRTLFFDNPVVDLIGAVTTLPLPYYAVAAVVALTLNTGAHLAEVVGAGFDTVPRDRVAAARSLGATARSAHLSVIIPDGVRIAFPGVVNRLIHNLKNTALVSFVAVPDAYQTIQGAITKTFEATELLIFAALLYLALATVLEFVLRRIERLLWRGRPIERRLDV